jgi:cytidylate kinase
VSDQPDATLRTGGDDLLRPVVAIDGPSGSGKSTVARGVAARAGLRYLDTGAMYRAVAVAATRAGLELTDAAGVAALARGLELTVGTDPAVPRVVAAGRDVTAEIRAPAVSAIVSAVATNLAVRAELVARAREVIAGGGIVLEGRDTTTVIAPDAELRILLTADPQIRLARRSREVRGSADAADLAATHGEVIERDRRDGTVAAFTEAADGVHLVDTSALGVEEAIGVVLDLVAGLT